MGSKYALGKITLPDKTLKWVCVDPEAGCSLCLQQVRTVHRGNSLEACVFSLYQGPYPGHDWTVILRSLFKVLSASLWMGFILSLTTSSPGPNYLTFHCHLFVISFHFLLSEIRKLLSCTCRPIANGDMNSLFFSYCTIQAMHYVCCGLHDPFNRLFPAPALHAGPLHYVRKRKLRRDPVQGKGLKNGKICFEK